MANWLTGKVVRKTRWTDRLYSLHIDVPLPGFIAGQFVRVALDIDGELVARPYSLVNAPGEGLLEIYFDIVPHGPLSPRLAALEPGDPVQVADKTAGLLVISEIPDVNHLWLLATGTGIGPFLSSLKTDDPWQRFDKIVLGYSVRTGKELSYLDTIKDLQQKYAGQLEFVPFVTREEIEGAINQRITTAIDNGTFEQRVSLQISADSSHIMMCGNSNMIMEATALLEKRGMRKHRRREPGHITTEKYH